MSNASDRSSKGELLQVRLTPEEKQAFSRAAVLAGTSVSSWARQRLRQQARRELEDANEDVPFIKPTLPE
jgi:uncharacterized protein (DUF1778 family)